MQSDYDKQAADFLAKTGATITTEYLRTAKYFKDDKEERDIYNITITRGSRSFSLEFGQSLFDTENDASPTDYDVLASLTKHHPGTFEDFCAELGYDTDSREAERVYHATVNEYTNTERLFSDAELEEMAEIN